MSLKVLLNQIMELGTVLEHHVGVVFYHDVLMALWECEVLFLNVSLVTEWGQVVFPLDVLEFRAIPRRIESVQLTHSARNRPVNIGREDFDLLFVEFLTQEA